MEFETDAYNYGFWAETFIGTYYRLRSRIDQMPNLETIVLPVSYASFSAKRRLTERSFDFISPWDLFELSRIRGTSVVSTKLKVTFTAFRRDRVIQMCQKLVELIFQGEIRNQAEMVDGFVIGNRSQVNRDNAMKAVDRLLADTDRMDPDLMLSSRKFLNSAGIETSRL